MHILPSNDELYSLNLCDYSDGETADTERIEDIVLEISEKAGCPIVFASSDSHDMIYSYYANPNAADDETYLNFYVKHIATSFSAFEFSDYADMPDNLYAPVLYKGYRIGRTICYDSTQPLFSRAFSVNGVDIIINSTGGHVDYKSGVIIRRYGLLKINALRSAQWAIRMLRQGIYLMCLVMIHVADNLNTVSLTLIGQAVHQETYRERCTYLI